jgi:hypothetical protein
MGGEEVTEVKIVHSMLRIKPVLECLLCMCKTLGLISSTWKRRGKERFWRRGE